MRFGTDGVRGVANSQLTPEFAMRLGRAAVRVLGAGAWGVGMDTRRSGPLLMSAVAAGLAAEGAEVELFGVAPTPCVAWWSQSTQSPAVMVSASHNPFADNGLKVFAAGGLKLSDAVQTQLEAELDALGSPADITAAPVGADVGTIGLGDPCPSYLDHLESALERRRLDGLSVVLDCANGAASEVGPEAFRRAGANVTVIHDGWDGVNINEACGSTHPQSLQSAVVATGADLGFAFDGDADRVLAVDHHGRLIDGDQLMAVAAIDLDQRGLLANRTVVVTVMSNLGFRLGMDRAGITVVETAVGDRYVVEAIESGGHVLGGEQSGHLIFRDVATTGDGVLSALRIAEVVVRTGVSLAELADRAMTRLPQVLTNVAVPAPIDAVATRLAEPIAAAEAALGATGRVLVRASGTEPLVRVMVEAADEVAAAQWADSIASEVRRLAG